MLSTDLSRAITLLRKKSLYPADIREAQELAVANGKTVNDIQVALYYAGKGDMNNAKKAAGMAADVLAKMVNI